MPDRWIRESAITSERVNSLDPESEVFYRRLLNKVDDYGLYDGRPSVLKASLYPLRLNQVREADILRWTAACAKAELIVLYESEGLPLLQVLRTGWKPRSKPKYPIPPSLQTVVNNCKQSQTIVSQTATYVQRITSTDSQEGGSGGKPSTPWLDLPQEDRWGSVQQWLGQARENGADYSEAEAKFAFLRLEAAGWKIGSTRQDYDWRLGIERQIQTDRKYATNKTTKTAVDRNAGTSQQPGRYAGL